MFGRVAATAASLTVTQGFPHYADSESGAWTLSPTGDWTGGHWVGELWLAAHVTGDPLASEAANCWSAALESRTESHTIFRSFLFYYGAVLGEILRDHDAASARALRGARAVAGSYNATARVIPLGEDAEEASHVGNGEASIDAVGSICGLLGWASQISGDVSLREIAREHTRRHVEFCIRDDASICQSATFDATTGTLVRRYTHKGYSDTSTWARAQAWGMLAFTLATRWLNDPSFIAIAERVSDWWLHHVPDDAIAYWDFDAPRTASTYRDTSATAIAAASLLKLAGLTVSRERAERYRSAAERTVYALVEGYLTPSGMLTHGSYNPRIRLAPQSELIWGDYYLLEALCALSGCIGANAI